MSRVVLVRGARQLVTCAAAAPRELHCIEDGAVLIEDGKIAEVGPTRRLERLSRASDAEVIDASGRVVMPGFVDCRVALLCGPPGYGRETDAVRAVRSWSAQRMDLEARRRLRWFLRSGVTSIGAGCGYGLDESTELKALRVIQSLRGSPLRLEPVYLGARAIPPEYVDRPAEYHDWLVTYMLPLVASRRLARLIDRASAALVDAAARHGLRAVDADSGALTSEYDVADHPAMTMAAMMFEAVRSGGSTVEDAIQAATIRGARALGIADRVGSIEPGKDADLLLLQFGDYRELCWSVGLSPVSMVLREGVEVYPRIEPR